MGEAPADRLFVSQDVCATLAQILPTFIIALAVEGALFRRRFQNRDAIQWVVSIYLCLFAIAETTLIIGYAYGLALTGFWEFLVMATVFLSVGATTAVLVARYMQNPAPGAAKNRPGRESQQLDSGSDAEPDLASCERGVV